MTTNESNGSGDMRTIACASNWKATATSILSVPSEFNDADYYSARPNSAIPTDQSRIMEMSEQFYYRNGLLRSIVDLIVEFAIDGIDICHTDEEMEQFYKVWQGRVGLRDRAERFATDLVRSGNVVLQRFYATIPRAEQNEWKTSGVTRHNNEVPSKDTLSIPIRYFFYRPSTIELVGGVAAPYSKKKQYGLRVDANVYSEMTSNLTKLEEKVKNQIPEIIKRSGRENIGGRITYALKSDDIYVASYKKDDYLPWAYPLTYSVLSSLIYNQKLVFAKTLALENFNNPVRLWKLGDHKEGILPPEEAADRLQQLIMANTGGGFKDFIWDSMIECEVLYPPLDQINELKEDKDPILTCFGISDDLTGGVKGSGSQTSNAYRIKAFVKKVETVRQTVLDWLTGEIDIITRNLNFDSKPIVRFKYDNLTDERVYLTMLREMADRNILSNSTLLERVGESAYIENHRINTEEKMRNRGTLPAKSSPFHNPNLETQHEMKMEEIEINLDNAVKEKPGGTNGRPPGAKDKLPRAKKSKAAQILDAKKLYEDIYGPVIEQALVGLGLSNARQLTAEQRSYIENNVNEYYANMIVDENNQIIGNNPNRYNQWQQIFADLLKDLPNTTVAEANYLKAAAYVELSV